MDFKLPIKLRTAMPCGIKVKVGSDGLLFICAALLSLFYRRSQILVLKEENTKQIFMLLRLTLNFSHPPGYEQENIIVENGLKNKKWAWIREGGVLFIFGVKEKYYILLARGRHHLLWLSPSLQEDTDFIFNAVNSRFYCGNPCSWNLQ